jgi:uncharacterized membrane protein
MNNSTKKLLIGAVAAAAIGGYVMHKRSHSVTEEIPADQEKCYGAALKGESSCSNKETCGVATANCDMNEWKLVPKGTCAEAVTKCKEVAAHEAHETPAHEAAEHEAAPEHETPAHEAAEHEEHAAPEAHAEHHEAAHHAAPAHHEAAKHPAHHAAPAHHEAAKHPAAHHAAAKHAPVHHAAKKAETKSAA